MNVNDKMDFFSRLGQSSIMAIFQAASQMLEREEYEDEDEDYVHEESLAMDCSDDDENWEGMPVCEGFNAFEEDPEEYIQGKRIGTPRSQLLVSSPYQGMLKPSPNASLFAMPKDY